MKYSFRESVASFIGDARIRTAVEALLVWKPTKTDVDQWQDLVAFYQAYAGAQVVRADSAADLHGLLAAFWRGYPTEEWIPLTMSAQVDDWGWKIDLDSLWEDWSFGRVFKRTKNGATSFLFLAISIGITEGVQFGFGIFDKASNTLITDIMGYEQGDVEVRWSDEGRVPLTPEVDITDLVVEAQGVWTAAMAQLP